LLVAPQGYFTSGKQNFSVLLTVILPRFSLLCILLFFLPAGNFSFAQVAVFDIVPAKLQMPVAPADAESAPFEGPLEYVSDSSDLWDVSSWLRNHQLWLSSYHYSGNISRDHQMDMWRVPDKYRGIVLSAAWQVGNDHRYFIYDSLIVVTDASLNAQHAFSIQDWSLPYGRTALDSLMTRQHIRWALQSDSVLYISCTHYEPRDLPSYDRNYIAAVNVNTGKLLWRSPANVSGAGTFEVYGDFIFCGQAILDPTPGGEDHTGVLYVLNRHTGEFVQQCPLEACPSLIFRKENRLFILAMDVMTNYDYEFSITTAKLKR
jgi:hypothetical protein